MSKKCKVSRSKINSRLLYQSLFHYSLDNFGFGFRTQSEYDTKLKIVKDWCIEQNDRKYDLPITNNKMIKSEFEPKKEIKYLGIIFNNKLSLQHYDRMKKRIDFILTKVSTVSTNKVMPKGLI